MNSWHVQRNVRRFRSDHMYIRYSCCGAPAVTTACRTLTTPRNADGNGNARYLDRHAPACPAENLMSNWQMRRSGGNIWVQYDCCLIQEPTTTTAVVPPTTTTTSTTTTTTTEEPTTTPRMCCRASNPTCLSCAAGLTVEQWCAVHEDHPAAGGCPGREATPSPEPTVTEAEVVEAVADPHMSSLHGNKFDLYTPGHHVLLTVPRGASENDAKLFVSAETERIGDRENDLWIRKLAVQGSWVGEHLIFETDDGEFNSPTTQRVQRSGEDYTSAELMAQTVPTLEVMGNKVDAVAPTEEFGYAISKRVRLHMGPVQANVKFATAFKNGRPINHLDFRAYGLTSVKAEVGGELADEASAASLFAFQNA